jgi:hypothetical protein
MGITSQSTWRRKAATNSTSLIVFTRHFFNLVNVGFIAKSSAELLERGTAGGEWVEGQDAYRCGHRQRRVGRAKAEG